MVPISCAGEIHADCLKRGWAQRSKNCAQLFLMQASKNHTCVVCTTPREKSCSMRSIASACVRCRAKNDSNDAGGSPGSRACSLWADSSSHAARICRCMVWVMLGVHACELRQVLVQILIHSAYARSRSNHAAQMCNHVAAVKGCPGLLSKEQRSRGRLLTCSTCTHMGASHRNECLSMLNP